MVAERIFRERGPTSPEGRGRIASKMRTGCGVKAYRERASPHTDCFAIRPLPSGEVKDSLRCTVLATAKDPVRIDLSLLFATDTHHLVIAALNDSYAIFAPGEYVPSGDIASLATRVFAAAFKIGAQLAAPFLVFGLVFNLGLGVLAQLMPQMQVYFVGVPLAILAGFLIFAAVLASMMGTFLDYFVAIMHELIPRS